MWLDRRTVRQEERLTGAQQDRKISGQINRKRDRQVTRWTVGQEEGLEEHIERWTDRQMNWNTLCRKTWMGRQRGRTGRQVHTQHRWTQEDKQMSRTTVDQLKKTGGQVDIKREYR